MLQVIKNVLVGITEEGKEEPSSALRYGLSLAQQAGAHVTVHAASLKLAIPHAWVSSAAARASLRARTSAVRPSRGPWLTVSEARPRPSAWPARLKARSSPIPSREMGRAPRRGVGEPVLGGSEGDQAATADSLRTGSSLAKVMREPWGIGQLLSSACVTPPSTHSRRRECW